ncbi:hypothetical protein BH10CYA1_BH10CYA1_46090 [soil metagenome]
MQTGLLEQFHKLIDKLMGREAEHCLEMQRLESTIHQHDQAVASAHDGPDLLDRVTDCASAEQSGRKWLHHKEEEPLGDGDEQTIENGQV